MPVRPQRVRQDVGIEPVIFVSCGPVRVRSPLIWRLGTTKTASPALSSSPATGPSPRSIATPATPAEHSRLTVDLIAAASWVKLNRPVTTPPPSIPQATWTSDAQSIPATVPSVIAAPIS